MINWLYAFFIMWKKDLGKYSNPGKINRDKFLRCIEKLELENKLENRISVQIYQPLQ